MSNPNVDFDIWLGDNDSVINSRIGANFVNGMITKTYKQGYYEDSQALFFKNALDGSFATVYTTQYSTNMNPTCVRELWIENKDWSLTGTTVSPNSAYYPQWRHVVTLPFVMLTIQSGGITFYVGDNPYTGASTITVTTANIPANTPYHLAYGYDYTQDIMKIWLDGVEIGSGTLGGRTLSQPCATEIALGGRIGGSGSYGLGGYITRFKQVNYWKTDFSDRNDPRSELGDSL